jgi:hypothetical protein
MTGFGGGSSTTLIVRAVQTKQILATAPWSSLNYESRINAAGPLEARIPVFDGGLVDVMLPGRVMIGVLRGSIPVWSGILWKRSMDPEGVMEIRCDEIMSYWDRRRIRQTMIFTQIDQASILSTLIDLPQRDAYGALGVTTIGNVITGMRRDRTYYAADRKSYGEMIRNLCGVIDGPDIKSSPVYANGIWADRFEVGYPRLGRTLANSHLTFIVGVNCEIVEWEEDAASSTTLIDCTSTNTVDPTNPLFSTYEAQFMYGGGWPRLEDALSFTDVSVQSTLNEKSKAEQAARSGVVLSVKIKLPDADEDPIMGSYGVGDDCRLIVPPGPAFVDGYDIQVRIAGIAVDAGQMDTVTITMAPALLDGNTIIPV